MKKKLILVLLIVVVLSGLLMGCNGNKSKAKDEAGDDRLKVVATLFPQYDFVREIAGDKADITLLMSPGVESHSYEPSPADIIKINESDLFIYTGKYMEPWAQSIIDGVESKDIKILNVSQNIKLDRSEDNEEHDDHEDEDDHSEKEHAAHEYDPHVWTSPVNAKIMVENILKELCELDPENADYYKQRTENYLNELTDLDNEFREVFASAKRTEIIFAGKFALHYFAEEYGMEYDAAFDSCSTETEPSVKVIAELIDEIKEENIPVVFYPELSDPKVARSISDETGAEMLLLHSCHNLSKDEFKDGATYLSLMKENAENLKIGLN